MASNMMDNLQAIVQNTAADSIKMIDVDELHESPDNFFAIEHTEELADAILGQGGVKDNLLVVPMKSGGYEIVSGHRRTAAVKLLLERGESISRYLPCLVQNYWDEDDKRMDMIC
ncbi:MAG: ParB N-terminal domain-containing protein [Oscillospiraceae bacterium]|nr:ParB N-terminal domain-containing protein [Oscillospiraceae bacterium]